VPKCNRAAARNREGCRGQTNCEALRRGGGSSMTSGGGSGRGIGMGEGGSS
jgi:hypothetical protein